MHFRLHTIHDIHGPAPLSKAGSADRLKSMSTVVALEISPEIADEGVDCWDWAYSTGRANKMSMKDTNTSTRCDTFVPACSILQQAAQTGIDIGLFHHKNDEVHNSSTFNKRKATTSTTTKIYLLSSPTIASIMESYTEDIISTLLSQPSTKLVYLVPQSNIVCPKVCKFMSLHKAVGSSIQVLPIEPETSMTCSPPTTPNVEGGTHQLSTNDAANVSQVVAKVVKNTKVASFDGYISFEEERAAWCFLEAVGQGVKEERANKANGKRR